MSRSPPKRHRPPTNEKEERILLGQSTFHLWNQKKIDLGFQENTNSELADFLLHTCSKQFEREIKEWRWMMEPRSMRTVSGLFCVGTNVSIAFPLFHLFTIVGDNFESLGISAYFNTTFQVGDQLSIQHQQVLKWQQWLAFPSLLF